MSEHTPGPWTFELICSGEDTSEFRIRAGGLIIADVPYRRTQHCHDNAQLIAAAPELLAALEAIIEDIETADEEESCRVVGSEKYHAGLEAIAKAKGKHNAQ